MPKLTIFTLYNFVILCNQYILNKTTPSQATLHTCDRLLQLQFYPHKVRSHHHGLVLRVDYWRSIEDICTLINLGYLCVLEISMLRKLFILHYFTHSSLMFGLSRDENKIYILVINLPQGIYN